MSDEKAAVEAEELSPDYWYLSVRPGLSNASEIPAGETRSFVVG